MIMLKRLALVALAGFACVLAAPAPAQSGAPAGVPQGSPQAAAAQRKAEHDRIRHERDAIKARRQQDEAACYQRFSVEDCLRGVRAGARDAESRLRAQEIELNDAERKEKAAERLKSIEEKQRAVVPEGPSAGASAPDALLRKPHDPQGMKSQRDQEAGQRAQQQRDRVQKQAEERAAHNATNAERAAQARERHAAALKAAQERRARIEKSQAEAAAQGRKPAAPLPAASAAR